MGVHFRRFWAYVASLVTLLFLTLAALLGWLVPVSAQPVNLTGAGLVGLLSAVGSEPYRVVASPLLDVMWPLQIVAMILALLYGVLRVGPDFERTATTETAQVEKGQRDPSRLYATGRQHADQGRWASAVLNWRLAAALDPGRAYYQRALGEGYARLGFYERSLDVLESARRLTVQAGARAEVDELIAWVSRQRAAGKSPAENTVPGTDWAHELR
jgi:tetratricopeptide (TPR) repeat protein